MGKGGGGGRTLTTGHLNQLTCSESCLPLRKKPSRQPMTTASTDRMSSPFCLQTFFTRPHTSSRATAILLRLLHLLLLLLLLRSWSQRLLLQATGRKNPTAKPPCLLFRRLFSHTMRDHQRPRRRPVMNKAQGWKRGNDGREKV